MDLHLMNLGSVHPLWGYWCISPATPGMAYSLQCNSVSGSPIFQAIAILRQLRWSAAIWLEHKFKAQPLTLMVTWKRTDMWMQIFQDFGNMRMTNILCVWSQVLGMLLLLEVVHFILYQSFRHIFTCQSWRMNTFPSLRIWVIYFP